MEQRITTLEQAEITLYRNNAIVQYHEQDMVEGKQLLNICGLSYTDRNWGSVLKRQFDRHSFEEGTDYVKSRAHTLVGVGNRGASVTVYVTVNAANHILLAAMTQEGQDARQDAIDMRSQFNQIKESNPILWTLMVHETKLQEQAVMLDNKADREDIKRIEERLDSRGCREGYILISDAHRDYGRKLSRKMFDAIVRALEVPSETIQINSHGNPTWTLQVDRMATEAAIESFYEGIIRGKGKRHTHPLFGDKKFQA